MRVLFITSSRIGDAVLSTGLLDYIIRTWPQARVTIVCGPLTTSLFEDVPRCEEIIPLRKQRFHGHWFRLLRRVAGVKWDMVIDLRNSAVSRLIRGRAKYIYGGYIDKTLHKVEQNAVVMKLEKAPAPRLWFTDAQKKEAEKLVGEGGPILAVGPTANWIGKTWPAERFVTLIQKLTGGGVIADARVAVFAAPGEEEAAYDVLHTVPEGRRIDVIARTNPGTAAAALSLCDFYVGNDSGLMHCAAAAGVPTVGLFGPSWPHLYRPWGTHTAYAATPRNFDELTDFEGYDPKTLDRTLMEGLAVSVVYDVCKDIINKYVNCYEYTANSSPEKKTQPYV